MEPKYTKCAARVFFSGINVLKNETILSQGDTTWMRVIAQGVLLLAVLVVVMVHSKYPYTAPGWHNLWGYR